jgi:peptidoglycan/LPS O-acetylase OafA/YrhL
MTVPGPEGALEATGPRRRPARSGGAPPRTRRIPYEPALDGVRAVAVSAVVVFHGTGGAASNRLGRGGFLGVDVFFVLSGYLITTLLLRERVDDGQIAFRDFWLRRARRLLPALVVMLAIAVIYEHAGAPQPHGIRAAVFPVLFYVQNWHLVANPHASSLSHTWSLAIEEQWYLVWPVVVSIVLARRRRPAPWMLGALGGVALASALWTAHVYSPHSVHAFYGTDTRGQDLVVGAFLAILLALRPRIANARQSAAVRAAGVVALAILVWAFATWRQDGAYVYRGGFLLVALASAVLIFSLTQSEGGRLRRVLCTRPVVALGVVSYGVYLYNPLIVSIVNPSRTSQSGLALFLLRCAITAVLVALSWHLVERPFRSATATRTWPWVALAASAAAVVLVAYLP